jgi:tetratricopeptide (TPR) repeat protein
VNAAYAALMEGPQADAAPQIEYYDFLNWIGAASRAKATLDQALARFPDSPLVQDRLRQRLLWEGGPKRLEEGYLAFADRNDPASSRPTQIHWFSGYASLVAAEQYRRESDFTSAMRAYGRAIEHFELNVEQFPEGKDNCHHYEALAHAAMARIALERDQLPIATADLLRALELRPDSAATLDGLGISPVATAMMLKTKLVKAGDEARAKQVQAALDALDPKLLEPPPFEQTGPARRPGAASRGAGRRGR